MTRPMPQTAEKSLPDPEQVRRIAPAGDGGVEIVGERRGHRVDRRAVGAHRGGQDAGDHQSGEPGGQVVHDEAGKDLVAGQRVGREPRGPDGHAHHQEEQELQDHHDPGADQGALRVPQRAGREQPLHDQMIGAVRRGREQRAAQQAAEQACRSW